MYVCMYVYPQIHTKLSTCLKSWMFHIYIYIYKYMHVCMYIHTCIHTLMLTKSIILLTGLAKDWTGARLLDIPNYQTVTQMTQVLTGFYFYYCFYTWAVQLTAGVFHLDIPFIYWFKAFCCSSVHSGVLLAEEVDGVGGKGSGDITMVEVETLLEFFLGMQNYLSVCPHGTTQLPLDTFS